MKNVRGKEDASLREAMLLLNPTPRARPSATSPRKPSSKTKTKTSSASDLGLDGVDVRSPMMIHSGGIAATAVPLRPSKPATVISMRMASSDGSSNHTHYDSRNLNHSSAVDPPSHANNMYSGGEGGEHAAYGRRSGTCGITPFEHDWIKLQIKSCIIVPYHGFW